MTGKGGRGNPVAVNDLASAILDPVLRKRTGISIGLVQSWDEIAGLRLAARTRPEKIVWPRRIHENDPFQPATLVIACDGSAALHLQHETGEIIGRVNAFLGFAAIGRIKIVQKPVTAPETARQRPIASVERSRKSAPFGDSQLDRGRGSTCLAGTSWRNNSGLRKIKIGG